LRSNWIFRASAARPGIARDKVLASHSPERDRAEKVKALKKGELMQRTFTIATQGQGLYEFTGNLREWVGMAGGGDGLLTLFIRHTSASLLIQENADRQVQTDLRHYFQRLVPPATDPSMSYLTHTCEGPDDMPAHIKAAMMPVSLSIPVQDAQMRLGTWQGVYVFEHRDAPHARQVVADLRLGDA